MVPVSFTFGFCGEEFVLLPCAQGGTAGSRALFWPRENALLVADLHLEKASFFARTGQFLPPYDSRETLERLAAAIKATGARRVYTLGDNFHDAGGPARLESHAAGMLDALTRACEFVWITGNHDKGPSAGIGGTFVEELEIAGMVLRHEAKAGEVRPELSGHFHPRLQIRVSGRHIRRHCAVQSTDAMGAGRVILPAFGALTGGMDAADPAILAALQPARKIEALVPAEKKLARFTLWQAQ
ncbi:ligase-associated DNA damage response endonuclease PdeM [Alteraurantiacibacter palmitatis]|uniref:Ligase-associated DNA damage response endonuclease PdeM n=1 Tax=Alteraurantiacibacter palmitatis TaxID=2054628 RepID=A0ABV7E8R8_9SPHN